MLGPRSHQEYHEEKGPVKVFRTGLIKATDGGCTPLHKSLHSNRCTQISIIQLGECVTLACKIDCCAPKLCRLNDIKEPATRLMDRFWMVV